MSETKPIHAVLRKINSGNDCNGKPMWCHVMIFPDVLDVEKSSGGRYVPAANCEAFGFNLDRYAETQPLDFEDANDRREYAHFINTALQQTLLAIYSFQSAFDWNAIQQRPLFFCLNWHEGETE